VEVQIIHMAYISYGLTIQGDHLDREAGCDRVRVRAPSDTFAGTLELALS